MSLKHQQWVECCKRPRSRDSYICQVSIGTMPSSCSVNSSHNRVSTTKEPVKKSAVGFFEQYKNKAGDQDTPTRQKKTTTSGVMSAPITAPIRSVATTSATTPVVTNLRGVPSKSISGIRVAAKAKAKF